MPQQRLCWKLLGGFAISSNGTFCYLWSTFNEFATDSDDISERIRKANASLQRIRKILWNRGTPRRLKVKMIMTFIYPTVTYSCETWCLGETERSKLDAWWMKLLRRVQGVTKKDRIRSKTILKNLKTSKLSDMITQRQLRYLGHTQRYPDERWVKFMQSAETSGGQQSGKQKQYGKHITNLLKQFGLNKEMMQDKDLWKEKLAGLFTVSVEEEAEPTPGKEIETPSQVESETTDRENEEEDEEEEENGIQT